MLFNRQSFNGNIYPHHQPSLGGAFHVMDSNLSRLLRSYFRIACHSNVQNEKMPSRADDKLIN